jgi:hypothetical protein
MIEGFGTVYELKLNKKIVFCCSALEYTVSGMQYEVINDRT